jgi:hypothetical protein
VRSSIRHVTPDGTTALTCASAGGHFQKWCREIEHDNSRKDLSYRVHVIPMTVPPLGERVSDLPLPAKHFCGSFAERSNKRVLDIQPKAPEPRALNSHENLLTLHLSVFVMS